MQIVELDLSGFPFRAISALQSIHSTVSTLLSSSHRFVAIETIIDLLGITLPTNNAAAVALCYGQTIRELLLSVRYTLHT